MPISLKPSEMSAGGGLWGDLDATVTGMAFKTSPPGYAQVPVTVLEVNVIEDSGEEHEQFLSCGKGNTPTPDGKGLEDGGKFNSGSNAGLFLASVITGGFPENRLEEDVSIMVGMKAHFERAAAPKRNIAKAPRADGRVFEDTVLIVTKVLQLPWDAPKTVKGKSGSAKTKTVAGKGGGDEIGKIAGEAVMQAVIENPDGLTKQQLAAKVFQIVKGKEEKAEIVKKVYDDAFLSGLDGITFVDGIVSM